jgi:DNA primase
MKKLYEQESKEYENNLWNKEIGKPARDYLRKRNIKPNTAKYWHLGYSPENFIPECYKDETNEKFKFWEKMNGRLTIPVYDQNGSLIAISGRAINPETKPKYMHYQFPTRRILFGLFFNEKEILKQNMLILTEGQMDVISAWQNGFKLCSCTFGAHFSSEQLAIASRYTDRVNVLYDDDDAGQEGANNSLEKIKLRGDVKVRILRGILKNGNDLDDWIKKNDYHFIMKIINSSKEDLLKYKLNIIK